MPLLMSIVQSLLGITVFPLLLDDIEVSFDPRHGVFGWLQPEGFAFNIFVISIVNGIGVTSSLHIALNYFSSLMMSNSIFILPLVG